MRKRVKRYERNDIEDRVIRLMDRKLPPSEIDRRLNLAQGATVEMLRTLWANMDKGSMLRI